MSKIIVLQGPPANGKTTWAKEFIKGKTQWIRVNRDEIRLMCGDYWIPSREHLINIYEELMIRNALTNNYNVIIDAANLNPKTKRKWEDIAKEYNAELEYKEFIIPYHIAIERDKHRDLVVGEDTIRTFYRKYYSNLLSQKLNEI